MPYAPGIQYRGDQYLYEGISDAGKAIAGAVKEYRANQKANDAADSTFELMMGTLAPMVKDGSIPEQFASKLPDMAKFSSLSLSKKQATLGQLATSMGVLAHDSQFQEQKRNNESIRLHQEAAANREERLFNQQQAEDQGNAGFLQDYANFSQMTQGGSKPPLVLNQPLRQTLQTPGGAGVAALARNPAASRDVRDLVLRESMQPPTAEAGGPLDFQEDPVTGARFARSGKSILPSGTNPANQMLVEPVTDSDGNNIGHVLRTGKTVQFIRKEKEGQQISPSAVASLNKTLSDLRRQIQVAPDDQKAAIQEQIDSIKSILPKPAGKTEATTAAPAASQFIYDPKTRSLKPR